MANPGETASQWTTARKLASELGYRYPGKNGLGRFAERHGIKAMYYLPGTGLFYGEWEAALKSWRLHGGRQIKAVYTEAQAEELRGLYQMTARSERVLSAVEREGQTLRWQVRQLKAQVEQLEQRVRQLEVGNEGGNDCNSARMR